MDNRKILLATLAVILVAGLFFRLFPVRSGYHYWDETVYLQHAEILTGESPNNYNEFNIRPPLFSLMLAGVFLVNSSLLSAHVAVAGLSSLGIILVYILGRELYSRRTAVLASGIYAASPLAIILSHDILVDPVLPLFWLFTAFSLTKAVRTGRRKYYLLTGLAVGLSVLMKFTSLVILPAVALVLLVEQLRGRELNTGEMISGFRESALSRNNWLVAAGFSLALAPYLLWNQLAYGSPLHVFFTAWTKSGAQDAFMTYLGAWNLYLVVPLYLGIPLFFRNIELEKLENYMPLVFFLVLYVPLQFVIANKEPRFLMPALPFMALIAAEGLEKLRSAELIGNWKFSRAVFAFLVLSSVILIPASLPERNFYTQGLSAEWEAPVKDAGEWLEYNTGEDAVIYANYQYPALGYYSKREIVWFREYVPLEDIIGEEIDSPGYIYYSKNSSYPTPSLEELASDPRFTLNKSFQNTAYLFYFSGTSR